MNLGKKILLLKSPQNSFRKRDFRNEQPRISLWTLSVFDDDTRTRCFYAVNLTIRGLLPRGRCNGDSTRDHETSRSQEKAGGP